MAIATVPAFAQETVYPIAPQSDTPTLLTQDHFGFVVEKSFEYKLTFGFPSMDKAWFVPGTKTRLVMLWLRIENLSQNPISLDTSKFVSTDDTGKTYVPLSSEETFDKIMAGATAVDPNLTSKTINRISLGKAGNKVTPDQIKEDILRYGLQTSTIPANSIRDGLLYYEAPKKKKFTITVKLGDLWSKPFTFATSKPK
jgi:hypothetical protein